MNPDSDSDDSIPGLSLESLHHPPAQPAAENNGPSGSSRRQSIGRARGRGRPTNSTEQQSTLSSASKRGGGVPGQSDLNLEPQDAGLLKSARSSSLVTAAPGKLADYVELEPSEASVNVKDSREGGKHKAVAVYSSPGGVTSAVSTSPLPSGRGRGSGRRIKSGSLLPEVGGRTTSTSVCTTSIAPGMSNTEGALPKKAKHVLPTSPKTQEASMPPLEVYHGNSSQENSPEQPKRKLVPVPVVQSIKETERSPGQTMNIKCSSEGDPPVTNRVLILSSLPPQISCEQVEGYCESLGHDVEIKDVIMLGGGKAKVEINGLSDEELASVKDRAHKMKRKDISLEILPMTDLSIELTQSDMATGDRESSSDTCECTIEVRHLHPNIEPAMLEMYFESAKSGGCNESVKDVTIISPEVAHVTFHKPEVAARVLSRDKHEFLKTPLQLRYVSESINEEHDKNKLFLRNIPSGVDEEYLQLFLEKQLQLNDDDFSKTVLGDVAVITFTRECTICELQGMISRIQSKLMKGVTLQPELYKVCDSIRLHNVSIGGHYTDEYMQLYFESGRSGGGQKTVRSVELLGNGEAVVVFEDPKDLPSVLKSPHKSSFGDGVKVEFNDQLCIYQRQGKGYPATPPETTVGVSSSSAKPKTASSLALLELKVKPIITLSLKRDPASLKKQLESFHVELDFDTKTGKILVNSTKHTPSGWQAECQKQLEAYVKDHYVVLENIRLPKEGMQDAATQLSNVQSEMPSFVFSFSESNTLSVAGSQEIIVYIRGKIEEISEQYTETQVAISLREEDCTFFTDVKLPKLKEAFPVVTVTSDTKKHALQVVGSVKSTREFQKMLPELCMHKVVPVQIDRQIVDYLRNKGHQKLLAFIQKKSYPLAVHFVPGKQELLFLCEQHQTKLAEEAAENLKETTVVSRKSTPNSFQSLMPQLEDFDSLLKELESQNAVEIKIGNNNLIIAGFLQGVQQCERHLLHYIKEKCTVEMTVSIEWGIWRLFQYHMKSHWQPIVEKCKQHEVHVREPSDENNSLLTLKGDKTHVENISQDISNLQSRVCRKALERDQPGTCEFFRSDKARLCLDGIEKHNVTIEVTEAEEDEVMGEQLTSPTSKFKRKCTAQLPNSNKQIAIYIGDITEFDKADVIVNAANDELKHIGGVAKAIADKGGPLIQEDSTNHVKKRGKLDTGDVWVTERVGNLPCKALVHAVGPRWSGGFGKVKALLEKACFRSLNKVGAKHRSISFPAISSGVYGFPIDTCAESMIKAFVEYSIKHPAVAMCEIYIVLFKESDASAFISALQKALPLDSVHIDQAYPSVSHHPHPQPAYANTIPGGQPTFSTATGRRKKGNRGAASFSIDRVKLQKGGLLDVKADAYVNSTNPNLDLSQGAVSQALLRAGGRSLQNECTQKAPVHTGCVVVTGPGNLPCRHVLHTVIPGFKPGGQAEKFLRKSVRTCLEKCSELKLTSVAFPSIGTGNLHFPNDIVAKVMVGEVHTFLSSHKSTSIATVHLVIFMPETHRAFQQEIQKLSTAESPFTGPDLRSPVVTIPQRQPKIVRSRRTDKPVHSSKTIASVDRMFTIGQLRVSVVQGDIGDENSDVIVVPTNENLQLAGQGVAGAIRRKGGDELQGLCDTVIANGVKPTEGKVITTPVAGALKSKSLFHIVFDSKDDKKFTKVITACLQKAEEKKYQSISFPAIGTGVHGYPPQSAAIAMLKAIQQYSQKLNHLRSVRIVLFQLEVFGIFHNIFQNPQAAASPGFLERAKNWLGLSAESPQREDSFSGTTDEDFDENLYQEVVIRIYGETQQVVDHAADQVDKLIEETFTRDQFESDYVNQLRPEDESTLRRKAKELHVHVEIDKAPLNTIQIKGNQTGVHKMKCFVTELISEVERAIKRQHDAEQLQKTITWTRTDSNSEEEEYSTAENFMIETAFRERNGTGKFRCGRPSDLEYYTIDFDKMEEIDHNRVDAVCKVERVDLMKKLQEGEKPSHWDKMPMDPSTGKERPLHVVDLNSQNQEYQDMKKMFDATMQQNVSSTTATPAHPHVRSTKAIATFASGFGLPGYMYNTIVKIQRIQNPALYFQYIARKKEMDKFNPQGHKNERRLFHGTKPDTCSQINHGGFNRSYCGQNATVYGKGVYFARDAEYSARPTYSPPDGNGYKYIYVAKVLTGEFTKGGGGMLVPPHKDPLNQYILFDSVVDQVASPGIFVVFQDAQNYPEYLITFY